MKLNDSRYHELHEIDLHSSDHCFKSAKKKPQQIIQIY